MTHNKRSKHGKNNKHKASSPEVLLVEDAKALKKLCDHLRKAPRIALDTEFIPEHTFKPVLCLVQVATHEICAVIDTLAISNVNPLWEAICRKGCEVIVHAGRAEMDFCLTYAGRLPGRVVDVQLLSGFIGLGYPISYSKLVREIMDVRTATSQTRTDWRKRPLTAAQIRYAAEDVEHLFEIRDRLMKRCRKMRRLDWFQEETARVQENLQSEDAPKWKKTSGSGALEGIQLAVLQELVNWRESRAARLDKPRKRVMADEFLIELSKIQPTDRGQMSASRRLAQFTKAGWMSEVFEAIQRGLDKPRDQWPRRPRRNPHSPQKNDLLPKILGAVVAQIAEERLIAPSLLGTKDDLCKLIEWQRGGASEPPPRLARGWRERICGRPLTEIMEGRLLIGIEQSQQKARLFFAPDTCLDGDSSTK